MVTEFDYCALDDYDKAQFDIENERLIKFTGTYTRVKIPRGVTEICEGAFSGGGDIVSLYIPYGVAKIAQAAFSGCGKLERVRIPMELVKDFSRLGMIFGERTQKIEFEFTRNDEPLVPDMTDPGNEQNPLRGSPIKIKAAEPVDFDMDFANEDPLLKFAIKRLARLPIASVTFLADELCVGCERMRDILAFLEKHGICRGTEANITAEMYKEKFGEDPFAEDEFDKKAESARSEESPETDGELIREALRLFIKCRQVSASRLQRTFRIGYNRAMHAMAFLEKHKFVSPSQGRIGHKLYATEEDFERAFGEPFTMTMHLADKPFEQMASGRKTVEIRVNDFKRKTIYVGDTIEFVNGDKRIETRVTRLLRVSTFEDLPEIILYRAGFFRCSPAEVASEMRKYYSEEEIERHGILGIAVKVLSAAKIISIDI